MSYSKAGAVNGIYREDIDRLRGLAVLSVVAFHFDAPVYGGYVGVDIFFVISGFLITQIIQRETRAGLFSFAQFYERRLRRLLPALYLVVLASALPALYLLLPSERLDFFRSIVAVVTFTSNILFWSQSGYFDRAAVEKPLLHTWSLSVEEQFYLVLPILIWLLVRFRAPRAVVAAAVVTATIASFALGLWLLQSGQSATSFFMSPARAWEFLVGSVIALEGFPILRTEVQRLLVGGAAYVLLLVPIFGLRPSSPFPGWNALVPCLGAALFIWSGTGAGLVGRRHWFSPFRWARFFGTISYSMYLWHWPLFTFVRFAETGLTLNATEKVILFGLTTVLSYLSWAFVEQPFRRRIVLPTQRLAFVAAAAASICLVVVSTAGKSAPKTQPNLDQAVARLDAYNNYDEQAAYRGACFLVEDIPLDQAQCLTMAPKKLNILLWGDSHAAHYYPGLVHILNKHSVNLMQATYVGCRPSFRAHEKASPRCRHAIEGMAAWFASHKPDVVILSGDWMGDVFSSRFDTMIDDLRNTIDTLTGHGIRTVLLGPAVQFKTGLPSLLARALLRNSDLLSSRDLIRSDIFAGDAKMKAALPSSRDFTYISVIEGVCPAENCPLVVQTAIPLTWDYGHLTVEGSEYVIGRLVSQLKFLGEDDESRSR